MADIRIATRWSTLARTQSEMVAAALSVAHPGLEVALVPVTTTGDRDRVSPVAALTEVGAFVRSVQIAVLEGEADIAVHSGKDLPVAGPSELSAVYPERERPWDVLCGRSLADLPPGGAVGTGSPRRTAQLSALRPDLRIGEIRGNVETRLAKVESGEFDAVVLAEAGLRRLGLEHRIAHRFNLDEMVPAAAQAALSVESVTGSEANGLLAALDHPATRRAVETERLVLERSGAGCRSALGVLATPADERIDVVGFVDDERGSRRATVSGTDPADAAAAMCVALDI